MNKDIVSTQKMKKIASFTAIILMLFSSLAAVNIIVKETRADGFGPEITDVHHTPKYPTFSENVTVNATVIDEADGVKSVDLYYCYEYPWGGGSCLFIPMEDPDGDDVYGATIPHYPGGTIIDYEIQATDNDTPSNTNITEKIWFMFVSYINITEELSPTTCFIDDDVWVNGTAIYNDNASAPAEYSDVNVTILETGDYWVGVTDENGNYNMQITAPMVDGIYNINVTVSNRTLIGYNETSLTVYPLTSITVTENLDPAVCYPEGEVWVNGSAEYNSGKPVALSDVNVTIVESGMWWMSATDLNGDYSVNITAPDVIGSYTLNVTITNTTYSLEGYNEKDLTVTDVPIPDLTLSQEDITFSKDFPLEGDEIVINVVVHNQGTESVTNVLVNFSLDAPSNWFGSDEISVNMGGSDVASVTWTAIVGNHTIWVIVDPLDAIIEVHENNNDASKNISVDKDTDGDGIGDSIDEDDDNDGYNDTVEMSEGSDPLDNSSIPADLDGDFIPDSMDPDIDDDGVLNDDDAFPYDGNETVDTDEDGVGDNADEDDDGDGYSDDIDPYLLDSDNDGLSNDMDEDDDNDGLLDGNDTYPFDTDNDGSRNDVDEDDDNDGLSDSEEDKNWNGLVDDGETDPLKWDTDGDEVNDKNDAFPLDPNRWAEENYWLWVIFVIIVIILLGGTVLVMWTFKRKVEKEKK